MKIWDIIKKTVNKLTDYVFAVPPQPCFIESMKVLEYHEGDVIVLQVATPISNDAKKFIKEQINSVIEPEKRGVKVMILDGGADIGILRRGTL